MNDRKSTQSYWEQNIESWGEYYLQISHSGEKFDRPRWFEFLYKIFIMPIESKLMKERYKLTMKFITEMILPSMVVVDAGCGTGIFTVEMLRKGAHVIAIDYAQSALDLTKSLIEKKIPQFKSNAEFHRLDLSKEKLPPSDAVLLMGVTPYIENIASLYENVLLSTKMIFCLIIDSENWINKIRKMIPFLNVRNLHCFNRIDVDSLYKKYHWKLINRQNFATGYIDLAIQINKE